MFFMAYNHGFLGYLVTASAPLRPSDADAILFFQPFIRKSKDPWRSQRIKIAMSSNLRHDTSQHSRVNLVTTPPRLRLTSSRHIVFSTVFITKPKYPSRSFKIKMAELHPTPKRRYTEEVLRWISQVGTTVSQRD